MTTLKPTKDLHIYLISDSSCETVISVSRAVLTQFQNMHLNEYLWPLIRTNQDIDHIINLAKAHDKSSFVIIIHTMIKSEYRDHLINECLKEDLFCICAIDNILMKIQSYLKIAPTKETPGKYTLDSSYFSKWNSLIFTLKHDDGQAIETFNLADIVILGVSRSSKTPTSLYLAQRGYKVANLPIIYNMDVCLKKVTHPLIVGIEIDAKYLLKIRKSRFSTLNDNKILENYLSLKAINQEILYARKIFNQLNIPIVNSSNKAIEEIASEIINLFFNRKDKEHLYNDFTTR